MLSWMEPNGMKIRLSKAFEVKDAVWGSGFIEVCAFDIAELIDSDALKRFCQTAPRTPPPRTGTFLWAL